MKYLAILLFLVACDCPKPGSKDYPCKTVSEVGGCDKHYCGVKFTDGTFASFANNPVVGMEMCSRDGRYWHQKR